VENKLGFKQNPKSRAHHHGHKISFVFPWNLNQKQRRGKPEWLTKTRPLIFHRRTTANQAKKKLALRFAYHQSHFRNFNLPMEVAASFLTICLLAMITISQDGKLDLCWDFWDGKDSHRIFQQKISPGPVPGWSHGKKGNL